MRGCCWEGRSTTLFNTPSVLELKDIADITHMVVDCASGEVTLTVKLKERKSQPTNVVDPFTQEKTPVYLEMVALTDGAQRLLYRPQVEYKNVPGVASDVVELPQETQVDDTQAVTPKVSKKVAQTIVPLQENQ